MKHLIAAMTLAALGAAATGPALAEPPPHAERRHIFAELELTDAQRERIREIRAEGGDRDAIRAVLTDEQRAKLDAAREGRGKDPGRRAEHLKRELGLSDAQAQEIREIFDAGGTREEVRAVLTEEQRGKLDALRAQKKAQR